MPASKGQPTPTAAACVPILGAAPIQPWAASPKLARRCAPLPITPAINKHMPSWRSRSTGGDLLTGRSTRPASSCWAPAELCTIRHRLPVVSAFCTNSRRAGARRLLARRPAHDASCRTAAHHLLTSPNRSCRNSKGFPFLSFRAASCCALVSTSSCGCEGATPAVSGAGFAAVILR
jgi:hypothetical protein